LFIGLHGCGYHLRGLTDKQLKTISIEGISVNLTSNLKKDLLMRGFLILKEKENPELRIEFINENQEKRILSLNGDGLVREYELSYKIRYRTKFNNDEKWSDDTVINIERNFTYSDTNLLSKQEEEQKLNDSILSEASLKFLSKIQLLKN